MDIKVNNIAQVTQVPDTVTTETGDGTFKFTLASAHHRCRSSGKSRSFDE